MQLVAYGAQDVYLTGNPQITMFKVVYRRHTNFAIEAIDLPIDTARLGGRITCQILRNGDLVGRTFLRVTMPNLIPSNSQFSGNVCWVRRVGHAMIKDFDILIGGSQIDKHYGIWLDVWNELTQRAGQERGYAEMIGDTDDLTTLAPQITSNKTLFMPLQFWFCRNYGLALPLIALQYHDVRINFTFEQMNKLVLFTRGANSVPPVFTNTSFGSSGLLCEYIYLDAEERRRFAQVGHEYLIEQMQTDGALAPNAGSSGSTSQQSFLLNYNHPCKEFIWTQRLGAFNGSFASGNDYLYFLAYTNDKRKEVWNTEVLQMAAKSLAASMVSVDGDVWTASNATSNVMNFAFIPATQQVVNKQLTYGAGVTINFTIVNTGITNLSNTDTQTVYVLTNPISLGAINLADGIHSVTLNLDYGNLPFAVPSVSVDVNSQTLLLENISIPLSSSFDATVIDRRAAIDQANDVAIIQPNNYGLALDGSGLAMGTARIQMNGHDRFPQREAPYFNFVQTQWAHTRTPADGIFVYAFALHPEEHQPSGSCNQSRIDTTKLLYTMTDTKRTNNKVYGSLNIYNGTEVWIFATNYNVLRVMSGMAGLAYAN